MAASAPDPAEVTISIRYSTTHVPGRGWVAHAPDLRATAQGETEDDAFENLKKLVDKHPDLLDVLFDEVRKAPSRHMDLVLA